MKNKNKILITCAILVVAFISVYGYKNNVSAARAETPVKYEQTQVTEVKETKEQNTEVIFISCNGFF